RNRIFFFQSLPCPGILENDFQLGAADYPLSIDDETCRRHSFRQSLQTVPACLRNFSQLLRWVQNKIDNYQREIAVAQKEISGFDSVERFPAANPKQMPQRRIVRRTGVKRIRAIDQCDEMAVSLGRSQKRVEERRASGAGSRCN